MPLFGPPNIEKLKERRDVEGLIKALRHNDAGRRDSAVEALAELGDLAVGPLIAALEDEDPLLRRAAAHALGELRDAPAVEPLIAALKDKDADVGEAVMEALGKLGAGKLGIEKLFSDRNVKGLVKALEHKDPLLRDKAVTALIEIGRPAIVPLIEAGMKQEELRQLLPEVLSQFKGDEGAMIVIEVLKGAITAAHREMMQALPTAIGRGGIIQGSAIETALGSAAGTPKLIMDEAMAILVGMEKAAVIPLVNMLDDDVIGMERGYVERMLVDIGKPAFRPLITTLKGGSIWSKAKAADVLGELGYTEALEPLVVSLKDKHWRVRMAAARALGKLGDPRAVEPLIASLSDYERGSSSLQSVDEVAMESLVNLRDFAVEPLLAALKNEDVRVRNAAAEALGKVADPRSLEALTAALKDENKGVRWRAENALVRIGGPEAERALAEYRARQSQD